MFKAGQKIFIRTITNYYVGEFSRYDKVGNQECVVLVRLRGSRTRGASGSA